MLFATCIFCRKKSPPKKAAAQLLHFTVPAVSPPLHGGERSTSRHSERGWFNVHSLPHAPGESGCIGVESSASLSLRQASSSSSAGLPHFHSRMENPRNSEALQPTVRTIAYYKHPLPISVHTHIYIYICIYIHDGHAHTFLDAFTHIYMYICVDIRGYMHIFLYVYE